MINNQGHVKLADFGLSKIFHHSDNDNTIAANENGVLMGNCSLGTDIGGNIGCKFTSYHHGNIDDPISQRMRSSTRSCCGTLVNISNFLAINYLGRSITCFSNFWWFCNI